VLHGKTYLFSKERNLPLTFPFIYFKCQDRVVLSKQDSLHSDEYIFPPYGKLFPRLTGATGILLLLFDLSERLKARQY